MNGKIIGVKCLDYENKKGRRVIGKEVVLAFDDKGYDGFNVDRIYIRSDVEGYEKAEVGAEVSVLYDKKANVAFVL